MNTATKCKGCKKFEVVEAEISYKVKDHMGSEILHGPYEVCEDCYKKLLIILGENNEQK